LCKGAGVSENYCFPDFTYIPTPITIIPKTAKKPIPIPRLNVVVIFVQDVTERIINSDNKLMAAAFILFYLRKEFSILI
jgi:hypothetical protein